MNTAAAIFFGWLLRASWQASILVLIVLAVQWALQKRLSSRWRSALWLLVLARLLLPSSLPAGFSVFNYARLGTVAVPVQPVPVPVMVIAPINEPVVYVSPAQRVLRTEEGFSLELRTPSSVIASASAAPISRISQGRVAIIGAWLWLVGVLLLAGRVIGQNTIFLYRLRSVRRVTEPEIIALFEHCKSVLKNRFEIRLLETDKVKSPALYGFFRPTLLLPVDLIKNFSREELRYIFLHELAHVKRRDMAVHWLATALQILHWFNPVFWFGFRRLAADRELACDELALSHAGESESRPYGETIVKLLEICARPAALPGLLGILEDKAQMKRRISMIAAFKKHSRWSAWAAGLVLVLGLVTLTDAQMEKGVKPPAPVKPVPMEKSVGQTNLEQATAWAIAGRVLDAETKRPLARFHVTPRYTDANRDQRVMDREHTAEGTNGNYLVYLDKRLVEPILIVEAEGYLPAAASPWPRNQTNFDFVLNQGSGPKGTVLTPNGKPAARVAVVLFYEDIDHPRANTDHPRLNDGVLKGPIQSETEADGSFSFKPVLGMRSVAAASAEGFKGVTVEALAANPKLVLEAWGQIKGTLKHASGSGTNKELELSFAKEPFPGPHDLFLGYYTTADDKGRFVFDHVPSGTLNINYRKKLNQYSWKPIPLQEVTVHPGQALNLKIAAPDLSHKTSSDRWLGGSATSEVEQKHGPDINGTVLTPDGKNAENAQVALSEPGVFLSLGKGAFYRPNSGLLAITGTAGKFSLPTSEKASYIAVHESGYAEVTLAELKKSGQIQLQPWGRVEGTLRLGDRLGANEKVSLTAIEPRLGFYSETFETRTDDQGRFAFTFVPPGEQGIARMIPRGTNGSVYAVNDYLMVKPGGVTQFTLGGQGRRVTGQAIIDDPSIKFDWKYLEVSLFNKRERPSKKLKSREEIEAWQETEEGKMARRNYRIYPARVLADGSFQLENVDAGTYTLSIHQKLINRDQPFYFKSLASLERQVVVPAGKINEPVDLGLQKLKQVFKTKVGDVAAPFTVKTLDGKSLKLADYDGKYVVLNFWESFASDRGGDEAVAALKKIQKIYAHDDRVAIIGLTLDDYVEATEYSKKRGMNWPLGFLDDWKEPPILASYGLFPEEDPFGIPAIFLIGPDGKILAQDLQGKTIQAAVEKALAKKL